MQTKGRTVPSHGLIPSYFQHNVYFATNRGRLDQTDFGVERSDILYFGLCKTTVPRATWHKIGNVERPPWWDEENPDNHVTISQPTEVLGRHTFYETVKAENATSALVFVHGFNTTFRKAIMRVAQIKHDLQFGGSAILYSWPSAGQPGAYFADQETVDASQFHLEEFLAELVAKTALQDISIIAHSMGNRVLASSLEKLSLRTAPPFFRNIILAAPDVDRGLFRSLAPAIASRAESITLYASSRDWALQWSRRMHAAYGISTAPRAGDCSNGDIVTVPNYPNVTSIDVQLGHSFITSSRNVLNDLSRILKGEMHPPRFGLELAAPIGTYWRLLP